MRQYLLNIIKEMIFLFLSFRWVTFVMILDLAENRYRLMRLGRKLRGKLKVLSFNGKKPHFKSN